MEKFKKEKIDWDAVRKEIEDRTGQLYAKGYIMGDAIVIPEIKMEKPVFIAPKIDYSGTGKIYTIRTKYE